MVPWGAGGFRKHRRHGGEVGGVGAGGVALVKSWRLWFLNWNLKIHEGRVGWGSIWSSPFWQQVWKILLLTMKLMFLSKKKGISYGSETLNFSFNFVRSPSLIRGIATSLYGCMNLWVTSSLSVRAPYGHQLTYPCDTGDITGMLDGILLKLFYLAFPSVVFVLYICLLSFPVSFLGMVLHLQSNHFGCPDQCREFVAA